VNGELFARALASARGRLAHFPIYWLAQLAPVCAQCADDYPCQIARELEARVEAEPMT
jgi:hypothetical protein